MENKKKLIMVVLSVLVCVMAVGYAVLSQQLNINGTASIDSTWKVEITNITEGNIVGDATNKETPSYSATTANFSVGLTQPGDSITYDIEVSNLGTLKAKVDSISVSMDTNDAIIYTTKGLEQGDTLGVNEKDTLSVTVTYNPEVTSQPSVTLKEITVTINYVQDLGQSSSVTYDTYSIGDTITFAGSNWYVIKNSSSEEDYVTLLKGTILSDTMSYNHGVSDYDESEVKDFLEGIYLETLGADNLKEVDGYKVRLITVDELNANLGWVNLNATAKTDNENANVPLWIYQNFGDSSNGVYGYWTMTPHSESSTYVWFVDNDGLLKHHDVFNSGGVRPVINLLKSSI